MTLGAWQVGEVVLTMLWFTCFFIWIWLFISVAMDVFRSHDMGGVAKAVWIVVLIFIPFFGVLVYLIARGGKMAQHNIDAAKAQDAAMKDYIRQATGGGNRVHIIMAQGVPGILRIPAGLLRIQGHADHGSVVHDRLLDLAGATGQGA